MEKIRIRDKTSRIRNIKFYNRLSLYSMLQGNKYVQYVSEGGLEKNLRL
jgi:hypothetical protein